jgi:hypothetical protein
VPSYLVLGGALEFIWGGKYRKDELYLLFVPITTGTCRTGQYYVFYENLFHDMHEIMKYTQEHFVNIELNYEIAVLSGSAAAEAGYSGIVNKLSIFMMNVLRFIGEGDLSGLEDGASL